MNKTNRMGLSAAMTEDCNTLSKMLTKQIKDWTPHGLIKHAIHQLRRLDISTKVQRLTKERERYFQMYEK